ncbi:hypothetical protein [Gimesia aquarii]|uniref:Uncharacterized protein n=1 Tax=Gimesia aquarii TaxID=2527964 RepID=A0A517VPB0_9PLAN|nr:hypothetical protein [Gimesia aquarii]QDT94851.1 hypothetical protein V144x_02840 [Gimesia aquarii]
MTFEGDEMIFRVLLSNVFEYAAKISTPIGVLAFAIAAWLTWQIVKGKQEERKLKASPEEKRSQLVDELLTRYKITGEDLSGAQRFKLIREEMQKRFAYRVLSLVILAITFVVCLFIASEYSSKLHQPSKNSSVDHSKDIPKINKVEPHTSVNVDSPQNPPPAPNTYPNAPSRENKLSKDQVTEPPKGPKQETGTIKIKNLTDRPLDVYLWPHIYETGDPKILEQWSFHPNIKSQEEKPFNYLVGGYYYVVIRDASAEKDFYIGWKDFLWKKSRTMTVSQNLFRNIDVTSAVEID